MRCSPGGCRGRHAIVGAVSVGFGSVWRIGACRKSLGGVVVGIAVVCHCHSSLMWRASSPLAMWLSLAPHVLVAVVTRPPCRLSLSCLLLRARCGCGGGLEAVLVVIAGCCVGCCSPLSNIRLPSLSTVFAFVLAFGVVSVVSQSPAVALALLTLAVLIRWYGCRVHWGSQLCSASRSEPPDRTLA